MKSIFSILTVLVMSSAAHAEFNFVTPALLKSLAQAGSGVHLHAGDTTSYSLNIASFIQGKLEMKVREETSEGFWLVQDVDLMIQKQTVETLLDKNDGHVIKMIVDGREQQPPTNEDVELVKMEPVKVTVPQRAEPYDAIHVVVKSKKDGKTQEVWVNPKEIPVTGMLKMINETPMGQMNVELVSFARAN